VAEGKFLKPFFTRGKQTAMEEALLRRAEERNTYFRQRIMCFGEGNIYLPERNT